LNNNYLYQRKTRGKIEILAAILQLCSTGQKKKTHIMYKANLSGEQNSYYLQELLQNKLIIQGQAGDGCLMYRTTQRGREYLSHYNQMMGLMELVQDDGNNILATGPSWENLVLSS
jgi:predicted transcriptional regulator